MDTFSILTLIGGLAMFLFGMNYMGDSLKKLSGSKLELILSKLTSNRFKGFLLGLGVTAIIQSSSATMVMLVGFVNSGIMKLAQTTSVLMGANIGTTVTGWILSTSGISGTNFFLRLLNPTAFTPVLAAIGIVMFMFSKSDKRRNVGSILIGFAVLMFGMETMSGATSGLQDSPMFENLLVKLSNPLMGILVGTVFTAIIQSSSASVGILQALSLTSAIPVSSALPVILGMNIGAAVPPVLSAISGNRDAKRVAASCVYGVAVTVSIFYALHAAIGFEFMDNNSSVFSIAFIHTMFNIISTVILMPFCKGIEKLSKMTFRVKSSEKNPFEGLDDRFLNYPAFATEQAREVTADMARLASSSVDAALTLLTDYSDKLKAETEQLEETIDTYEDKLNSYLVALSGHQMTAEESAGVAAISHIVDNVERISDGAYALAETSKEMSDRKIVMSPKAMDELKVISAAVKEIVSLAVTAIDDKDAVAAIKIESLNRVIGEISNTMKTNHMTRLQNNKCSTGFGFAFSNLLSNMGRISDRCSNIAVYLLQNETTTFSPHEYKSHLAADEANHLQDFYNTYSERYVIS